MVEPRRPVAYLVVPAVTLATATVVLLAIATPRTLLSARLWGGPTTAGPQCVRLQCVRRSVGVEDGVPMEGLLIEVDGASYPASCGPDGNAEVSISPARSGRLPVRVTRGPELMAAGDAEVSPARWESGADVLPAAVAGGGVLPLRAFVSGGTLLLERWGEVIVAVPDELREPGLLRLTASGAELLSTPHPRGLRVRLRPTFFNVTLVAEDTRAAPSAGPRPSWEVRLPVAMSGVAAEDLTTSDARLRGHLRTSTPLPAAHVRVQDQRGRIAAARVDLSPDGRGGAHAALDLPLPPLQGPAWLITSTSATGGSSIPWLLTPDAATLDGRVVPDVLWVDGVAPAVKKEGARLQRRLWVVGAVVVCGALLEALLLYERARASRLAFRRHLLEAGEGEPLDQLEERGGWVRVALTVLVALFGFVVVGALLVGRIE